MSVALETLEVDESRQRRTQRQGHEEEGRIQRPNTWRSWWGRKNLAKETEEEWPEGWEESQEIWHLQNSERFKKWLIVSYASRSSERSNKIRTGPCPLDWIWQLNSYCWSWLSSFSGVVWAEGRLTEPWGKKTTPRVDYPVDYRKSSWKRRCQQDIYM